MKKETIKLTQQEQHRISMECKRNPKRFWKCIHRKTMSKSGVGNLKWIDSYNCEQLAESDTDKAEALQKNFSSLYITEPDDQFEKLPNVINKNNIFMPDMFITREHVYSKLGQLK